MNFTLSLIASSIASHLATDFPTVTFYEGANQQGTVSPCCFIQQRYSKIKSKTSERFLRTIGIDLMYYEELNVPEQQHAYQSVADLLDRTLETFNIVSGNSSETVRTKNREWTIDLNVLHYKFDIDIWVEWQNSRTKMQHVSVTEDID